jgi:hypothetical protein
MQKLWIAFQQWGWSETGMKYHAMWYDVQYRVRSWFPGSRLVRSHGYWMTEDEYENLEERRGR